MHMQGITEAMLQDEFDIESDCKLRLYMTQYPQAADLCKAEQSCVASNNYQKGFRLSFSKIELLIQVLYIQWRLCDLGLHVGDAR